MATELQSWAEKATFQVTNCKSRKQLENIWAELYAEIIEINIKPATVRAAIRDVRKAINELPSTQRNTKLKFWALTQTEINGLDKEGKPTYKIKNGIVTMDKDLANTYKAGVQKNIIAQLETSNEITRKQYEALEKKCFSWLESFDYTKVAIAISFFTGRRAGEVLSTASFKRIRGEKQKAVFTGQLKKKSNVESFEIQLLCEFKHIDKAIKSLRGLKDFGAMELKAIEHKTNRQLAETMYKLFDAIGWNNSTKQMNRGTDHNGLPKFDTVPDVKFHDLRKLYISKILGGKSDRLTVQKLLGHDSLDTGKHYENWKIID